VFVNNDFRTLKLSEKLYKKVQKNLQKKLAFPVNLLYTEKACDCGEISAAIHLMA